MASEVTETHLNPLKLLKTLDKILPDNAILVADGGDFVGSAAYILRYSNLIFEIGISINVYCFYFRPRGPLKWLDPGAFGTLGVGGGFALGAKLARPDW